MSFVVVSIRKNESKKIQQGILWNNIWSLVRNKDQGPHPLNEEFQT